MAPDAARRVTPPWVIPAALLGVAFAARAVAIAQVAFVPTADSAYYVGVAARLASGQGLTSTVLWTYAGAPLTLPQPAFSLWMPLASLLAAVPMLIGGVTSLLAAQLAVLITGAALAPLTWYIADRAAATNGLSGRRRATVALGSGVLAAVFGPFLVAVTGPDSAVPFAVFGVAACCAMPAALAADTRWRPGLLLGVLLGLAYLARQEALWLGVTYLLLLGPEARRRTSGQRGAWLRRALLAPIATGLVIVAPWLLRQVAVFGSPFPGQAVQNLLFTRNEDVFAYAAPPTLAAFLAQGPLVILEHIGAGLWHQVVDVLVVPTLPVGLFGLLGVVWLWRTPALRAATALHAVILAGSLIFLATAVLFPVATLWGTFLHASGIALVALVVLAALATDRMVAAVGAWRRWDKQNAWLAPLLILALVVPMSTLEVWLTGTFAADQAAGVRAAADALATEIPALPDGGLAPVISDQPIGLALATGRPMLVLPDEPPGAVLELAQRFGARAVLLFGDPTRQSPTIDGATCFSRLPLTVAVGRAARLYLIDQTAACVP